MTTICCNDHDWGDSSCDLENSFNPHDEYEIDNSVCNIIESGFVRVSTLVENNPTYLLFVCRSCLCYVAWFSYWFNNLDLIIEGNTYRCCVASSLPLWGNTDVVQAASKGISGIVAYDSWRSPLRNL